jgi:glutathione synthase/RimK-type ligase-like ATP-grasp enzyme
MNILFVADPLESFKIYKDTTFAMMREAQRRGHRISACEPADMSWQTGAKVTAQVRHITLTGDADTWFTADAARPDAREAIAGFDAVVMRKDPPFDSEYFYSTHLLEQAEREGAKVFNKPAPCATTRKSSPSSSSRSSAARRWSRAARPTSSAFMPSTRTSSSSRWTAWAAWASSA